MIFHKDPEILKIREAVEGLNFNKTGKEREGGYFVFKSTEKDFSLISEALDATSEDKIEVCKVKIPAGKVVKNHLHNTTTEFFFGDNEFEIIVNNNSLNITPDAVLELPPMCLHQSIKKEKDCEFFAVMVRHGELEDKVVF